MKKIILLIMLVSLCACGNAIELCRDNNKTFPEPLDFPKVTINNRIEILVDDINLLKNYSSLPDEEKNNRNVLEYAKDTALKTTAKLGAVKYAKLFDGEISCAGEIANSRLHLYQTGIFVDLNKRLISADRVGAYITSSSKILKINAVISLYKLVDSTKGTYIAYDFKFNTNLHPNTTAPYFYSFKISDLGIDASSILKDVKLLGFSYTRLELTEDEKNAGSFTDYITDETDSESFVKLYDLSMPNSTWH